MKVFSTAYALNLAKDISKNLNVPLGEIERTVFPDGEKRIRILEYIADEDVILVACRDDDPDTFYFEIFFIVDALKRSGARKVILAIPYLSYQRQDHMFREGEAVSLDVVAETLERVGVDVIITFDLHSIKIPEEFSIPVHHLSALPLFAQEIEKIGKKDAVLVSPDMGGVRRIKIISEMLSDLPFASVEKSRNLSTGEISSTEIEGIVARKVFIVDDMISTGKTIIASAELLAQKGAEEIYVFATHPVFSENAQALLSNGLIKKVYVTDSIALSPSKKFKNLKILSLSDLICKEVKKIAK